MIPRYQRVLFWTLAGAIFLMTIFLLRGCEQAHLRLADLDDASPIAAPATAASEDAILYLASDADGAITTASRLLALPRDPTLRARTLLQHLLAEYAVPTSPHPLPGGPAIDDVFLLDLPTATLNSSTPAQLAVVNLHGDFAAHHPSGIQVEDLTIQSIVGTLHAALPQLTEVRFLVNGQPADTLAGHADLQRTYPASDIYAKPTVPTFEPNAHP